MGALKLMDYHTKRDKCFEEIIAIFSAELTQQTEEGLFQDMADRFTNCISIIEANQEDKLQAALSQFREYVGKVFSQLLELQQQKAFRCMQSLKQMEANYEQQISALKVDQLKEVIVEGKGDIGSKLNEIRSKAIFCSRLYHEM